MAEIDKLLKMQERELLKLEGREVAAFLKSYKASRLELRERLDAIQARGEGGRWTAQHTTIALAEVEDGIRVMQGRLGIVLSEQAIQRRDLALKHLTQTIGHFEPEFLGTSGGINIGAMRRLSESGELLLHKYSVANYSTDLMAKIQAELARGHSSRLSRSEVVRRIAGTSSVFTGMEHRAALIDRMENARAYDASFRAGLAEAAEELDEEDDPDPLLKKAVEFIDKRSHPFSAAVDGRVARVGGDWEVPLADVRAAGAKMKKGIGGVLWRLDGGVYKGGAYPAHYNDRGRGIPWRASWGAFRGPIPAAVKVAKPKAVPKPPPADHFDPARRQSKRIPHSEINAPSTGRKPGARRTIEVRDALSAIPRDVWEKARAKGAGVTITNTIGQHRPDLRGVRPRGWPPGSTWDSVRGLAQGGDAVVALKGTAGGGNFSSIALHEFGHTIDNIGGAGRGSQAPWFRRAMTEPKIKEWQMLRLEFDDYADSAYFLQAGDAGRQEAWAEILAMAWTSPAERATLEEVWPGILSRLSREIDRAVR